jgi:hypothetical protein
MADFTFYPEKKLVQPWGWNDPTRSIDVAMSFEDDSSAKLHRAIVCGCYAGKHCGVTARTTDHAAEEGTFRIARPDLSGYKPHDALPKWPADGNEPEEQLKRVDNAKFIDRLWGLAERGHAGPRHGIVVIAGETGARKTAFAREIARQYVSKLLGLSRGKDDRPHVITYEDPIESRFALSPEQASKAGFEYTPREKGKDVRDLDRAVTDALRQKPALLYVNEVRVDADWRSLMFFAGTGHFAVTTSHAGSLVETFERLLAAARASTAARRSEIASRIVAIVHVRWLAGQLIPAMWIQTARGRIALTQEGLGSLLPGEHGSCFGRAYFAKVLGHDDHVIKAAMKADLNGE